MVRRLQFKRIETINVQRPLNKHYDNDNADNGDQRKYLILIIVIIRTIIITAVAPNNSNKRCGNPEEMMSKKVSPVTKGQKDAHEQESRKETKGNNP